jgi:hypothetical protein
MFAPILKEKIMVLAAILTDLVGKWGVEWESQKDIENICQQKESLEILKY